jgi:hypothetical protein
MSELRALFDLSEKYKTLANNRLAAILADVRNVDPDRLVVVGVHFRGTDFTLILRSTLKKPDPGLRFYKKAFDFFRNKFSGREVVFVAVTDDPATAEAILTREFRLRSHRQIVVVVNILIDSY